MGAKQTELLRAIRAIHASVEAHVEGREAFVVVDRLAVEQRQVVGTARPKRDCLHSEKVFVAILAVRLR